MATTAEKMRPNHRRTCSLLELQAGIEGWESYVSHNEEKLKDTVDGEIKLAGLEA